MFSGHTVLYSTAYIYVDDSCIEVTSYSSVFSDYSGVSTYISNMILFVQFKCVHQIECNQSEKN
jgi:hypothetical protein